MTVYRRNPLLMTVMGANPGSRYQHNAGGPQFIVIDSVDGRVAYTKRATGMGNEAINSCVSVATKLANRNGRSYIVYLDLGRHRIGDHMNVAGVRVMGITEEVYPTRPNPFGEAVVAGVAGALVNRAIQSNPHLEDQPCATCGGSLAYQGTLGNREHYRCRNCGMDCSTTIVPTRRRHFRKLCAHGRVTGGCHACRGRKLPSYRKACIHGTADATRCLQCMRHQRPGGPVRNNPAIRTEWDRLTGRKRLAVLEFAGIPYEQARRLAGRPWTTLPSSIQDEVAKGWQENPSSRKAQTFMSREISHLMRDKGYPQKRAVAAAYAVARKKGYKLNPGPQGSRRRMTMTVERFAAWVKSKRDPAMWRAFLAKFRGYEKWTHGAKARKVTVEWVETPGVNGLWITYDGGKQPESTYIMPKGAPRKGAWKHEWDTMPDIKHDPEAGVVLTKLRGKSKVTDYYYK